MAGRPGNVIFDSSRETGAHESLAGRVENSIDIREVRHYRRNPLESRFHAGHALLSHPPRPRLPRPGRVPAARAGPGRIVLRCFGVATACRRAARRAPAPGARVPGPGVREVRPVAVGAARPHPRGHRRGALAPAGSRAAGALERDARHARSQLRQGRMRRCSGPSIPGAGGERIGGAGALRRAARWARGRGEGAAPAHPRGHRQRRGAAARARGDWWSAASRAARGLRPREVVVEFENTIANELDLLQRGGQREPAAAQLRRRAPARRARGAAGTGAIAT